MAIHPRTDIDSSAIIADDVDIGPGVCIGPESEICSGVELGANVIIGPYTTIRENARIFPGVIIGTEPQDTKFDGSKTICEVGERTVLREYVTINRGTRASGATIVGSDVYLMSYVHIAHDCRIGNFVTMANCVHLGGHCVIEDYATLGGLIGIHQFLRVGKLAMVGGMAGMRKDAPPYMMTAGPPPARVHGLNSIGLKRHGLSLEARAALRHAYKILFRSGLNFTDGLVRVESEVEKTEEVIHLVEFFKSSKRGISAPERFPPGHKDPDWDEVETDAMRA